MQIRDLCVAGSLTVLLGLGACRDATEPRRSNTILNHPLYSSVVEIDPDPDAPPMGIGGSVTITASGSFLPEVPLQASGLTVPPGIPGQVQRAGGPRDRAIGDSGQSQCGDDGRARAGDRGGKQRIRQSGRRTLQSDTV